MQTRVVPRGNGPVREIPARPVDLLAAPVADPRGGETPLLDVLIRSHTEAFLVLAGGELVCEYYAYPEAETTPHLLQSVTKSVIGCLAGILIEAGQLEPDRPVTDYISGLAVGGYANATVRDLLDMRTGGDYREEYDVDDSELAELGRRAGWWIYHGDTPPTPLGAGGIRAYLATVARRARHHGPFAYRSADTEVLGWIVEVVAGERLDTLIGRRILGPIGAETDGVISTDDYDHVLAAGGLALVPRDVLRFGWMLLDGGAVDDVQVVPSIFLRDTFIGQGDSVDAFRARLTTELGPDTPTALNGMYRNQFWVLEQGRRELLCLGVYGQMIAVDGPNRIVVVKLSSWPQPRDSMLFTDGMACLDAVRDALDRDERPDVSFHR